MSKLILRGIDVILDNDGDERLVGVLRGNTFITYRNPDKHLMRKWDAYGINSEVVDSPRVETVVIVENGKSFPITTQQIKVLGIFSNQGDFESQYFIPRSVLKQSS